MNSDSITIDGVAYVPAAEAAREAGVSRQTLWRWRTEGKVPLGRRYRDKEVLFTRPEVDRIREYAQRLEPLEANPAVILTERTPNSGAQGGEQP